jgi:hypothetical protein
MKSTLAFSLSLVVVACGGGSGGPASTGVDAAPDVAAPDAAAPDAGGDSAAPPVVDASDGSADAAAIDAPADAIATCPPFGNATAQCSSSCYANCTGLNANNNPDPTVHIGNCSFAGPGGAPIYCAPYGAADPCSSCP